MIIPVCYKDGGYDIVLGEGVLSKAKDLLDLNRKVLVVTDDGVPREYAERLCSFCLKGYVFTVRQGEGSKSIAVFEQLLTYMLEKDFSRSDCVVAVGGGVVGDLSGFAASAYMRGVEFYNVPTTLLSMVDSSIGGKTAVNLSSVKNAVGAFKRPGRVLIDPLLLSTLSDRQISNGFAEVIKMSLTSDKELFELIEKKDFYEARSTFIERALRIKKEIVEQDEREKGLRRVLNFGHTLGHGVESAGGMKELLHGECVALGMIPMSSEAVRQRLLPVLERYRLPASASFDLN